MLLGRGLLAEVLGDGLVAFLFLRISVFWCMRPFTGKLVSSVGACRSDKAHEAAVLSTFSIEGGHACTFKSAALVKVSAWGRCVLAMRAREWLPVIFLFVTRLAIRARNAAVAVLLSIL